jgi:hypothetical protein
MDKGKVLKITFEYENCKETLTGKQAEKWLKKAKNIHDKQLNHFLDIKHKLYLNYLELKKQNPFEDSNFKWETDDERN